MKRFLVFVLAATTLSLAAGNASADNIKGKVGVTGKIGFQIPSNGDIGPYKNETDTGFIGGGGFIYGIDNHFAAEFDITRSDIGSQFGNFGVTNYSLGAQYRFTTDYPRLSPYLGAGLDILINDADQGRNVDSTVGVHASGGADYFIMKQLALTAEVKLVVAPDADINNSAGKIGNFDPTAISTTFGFRFFFN
ncbi:MAG: outer membrane beta-barrel protein [Geobacter sp.]|nr:outer membrane beta-barrel protein [Geobacter sp.]